MKRGMKLLTIVLVLTVLVGCSSNSSTKDTFGYQSTFTYGDMQSTITDIKPVDADYSTYGIHNGVMSVTVECTSLKDGTEPDLERHLTMYDSEGREDPVVYGDHNTENDVNKLKADATESYTLSYGYDYEEPWYELQLDAQKGDSGSFKFSIDPDTLETSVLE